MCIRDRSYTLSNITARGLYEAYLFFFNAPLLTALAHKHKDLLPLEAIKAREIPKNMAKNENLQGKTTAHRIQTADNQESGVISDPALQGIIEGFSAHFEYNTRYLEPMIELKFEELFLHLALSCLLYTSPSPRD